MKILFINLPFSGHVYPTLGLVEKLVNRGNSVTYLLTEEWKDKVLEMGADFLYYEDNEKLSIQIKNVYQASIKVAHEFDLIIYEHFFFLGKHIAERFNKPVIRIITAPATNKVLMKEFINSGGVLSVFRFEWVCRRWTKKVSKGIKLKTDSWLKEITENPPELNLVYTVKKFQPYAEDFSENKFKFLGTSIYQRNKKNEFILPKSKNNLVYISLGTIVNKAMSFYKKCINAFKDENVTVIISVGNSINISDLGKIPNNFYIFPFVPQLEILEKASVFITHGGLNSVMESLYFGVPMVVIPFISDQPTNAQQIERLNLGKKISHKHITSDILKNSTLAVLNDSTITQSILLMQKEIRNAGGNEFGADLIIQYMDNKMLKER
ncbi:macrolide family glycosyltransferase [Clostridioides sp. ES-S-0190-01]|uniref:macrolide family glycosyltransferase n=1 Tax=Clostridioides sp. ES-S-0190-01 TaxID=2770787 RepID=UPI001D1285F7|nr:glycosyl transferase [Clostridioides sp. ES-S-0190-01]